VQSHRSSDRQSFDADHPVRKLPWFDLQKPFLEGPAAVPEAWGYGLKEIAKALGKLYPEIGVNWPEGLEEGLRAMVMGWRAYTTPKPLESAEMAVLNTYLEIAILHGSVFSFAVAAALRFQGLRMPHPKSLLSSRNPVPARW